MTTRKLAAVASLLVITGCATPGPLHLYSLPAAAVTIADLGDTNAADTPSFVREGETVTGFAYDPFTDHFFVRLAPGEAIRVVDRPARAIKREFKLAQLLAPGAGDLAIRPRDGHVFAVLPGAALAEFTRYGEFLRTIPLGEMGGAVTGVAFDSVQNRLLLLTDAAAGKISVHTPDGRFVSTFSLDRAVAPGCLAFDAEKRELYASRADRASLGVFDESGKLRRTLPLRAPFFDVGPRSLIRMF